jgi:hypothetical protein
MQKKLFYKFSESKKANSQEIAQHFEKPFCINNKHCRLEYCSARDWDRIGLLEEIPRSGVQIPCLT